MAFKPHCEKCRSYHHHDKACDPVKLSIVNMARNTGVKFSTIAYVEKAIEIEAVRQAIDGVAWHQQDEVAADFLRMYWSLRN